MERKKIMSAKEKQLVGLIAVVVVAIAVLVFTLGYMLYMKIGTTVTENKYDNSLQYSGDGAVSDSLQGYISYYLQNEGEGAVISDDALERIVAEITTGVLNSLPDTLQKDTETVAYIRKMISESVTEEIEQYNEEYLASGGYEYAASVSNDLLYYIDNVVVPVITAELQMDEGEVKDLIETLVNSSEVYRENTEYFETLIKEIEQELQIINVGSATYEEDITNLLENLSKLEVVLENYKSQTSVQITTYDSELASIKLLIQEYYISAKEYTDAEIAIIKEELNAALADMDNNESIQNIVNTIEIKNEEDLLELEKILREEIEEGRLADSEELESVMNSLKETITGLQNRVSLLSTTLEALSARQLEDLRQSLQDQIDANTTLTETQRKDLESAISKATSDASLSVAETKKVLEKEIKEKTDANTEALNRFIETLYGDTNNRVTIAGILSQIRETSNLTQEQKDALVEMIESKYADVSANTAAQVNDVKSELRQEVSDRNEAIDNAVSSLITSLETKVAELEKKVNKLISNQIEVLKNNLLIQIQNNKDLSEEQKAKLEDEILNLAQNSATADDLGKAVTDLTNKITQSSEANREALNEAINKLLGEGSTSGITIAELEKRIENADISEEEKKQISEAISKVYADASEDATVKVGEAKEAIQKEIDSQAEKFEKAVSSLQTSVEIQIANLEARLTKLTETQIETVKNNLLLQIQNNKELSEEQKAELEGEIINLAQNSATAEGLSEAIAELTAKIAQSTQAGKEALNEAISKLLGEGSTEGITIAELEKRIANADISDEEKKLLNETISKVYADASADTTVKVGEVKDALQKEIDEQAEKFTNAVTSLQTELEVQIANIEIKLTKLTESQIETLKKNLLLQIQSNKDLSDEQKAELEEEILNLAQKSATAEELSAAIEELTDKISQSTQASTEALNEAISKLLGEGSTEGITIAELEERIANADISDEEKKKLNDAISKVYADAAEDTSIKVGEAKEALQKEIKNQAEVFTEAVASLQTELEIQIANLEAKLRDLTETQLKALKNSLEDQINANTALSLKQKEELLDEIDNLENSTATSILELETSINEKTQANADALNDFIRTLYGDASGDITIGEILDQIEANTKLTNEQKKTLTALIEKRYTDATENTTLRVEDAKAALQEEIDNQVAILNNAVDNLMQSLETEVNNLNSTISANKAAQDAVNSAQASTNQSFSKKDSQLESSINANKTAQDAVNTNQANTNQNLQNQLNSITSAMQGDCEIKYVNGEFIVYNPEGTVSKKLVFAE